ncbi:MAG: CopG family transcriptional regulator [Myxococcota bacterium]
MPDSRVTIKIPRSIYDRIRLMIDHSGFSSPTDFIVYVLRDLVLGSAGERPGRLGGDEALSRREIEAIRQRLKNLGYL